MNRRLAIPLLGLLVGVGLGLIVKFDVPTSYARYLSIAVLAVLNSGLGGLRAFLGRSFALRVFLGGLLLNTALATLITFLGDRLGVNLYLAAAVALSVRVFHNLATLRRITVK